MIKIGVLTVLDDATRAEAEADAGQRILELLPLAEFEVVETTTVPDEVEAIRVLLREWAARCDAVITAGGTGLAPRDVTPEATRSVLDRECPGIAEAIRAHGYRKAHQALLSRGLAGTIGSCLVVNLPGGAAGAQDGMDVLLPILADAVEMIRMGGPL